MKERTIDAIYLCPNINIQGGHVCMNLSTGKRITRNKITPVPMSEVVKNRVEQIATDQGITLVKFTNKKGIELPNVDWIEGVDYDIEYHEINDHDRDDTYEYQQDVDENLNVGDEEIDQKELDNLLADNKITKMLILRKTMVKKKSMKNKVKKNNLKIKVI